MIIIGTSQANRYRAMVRSEIRYVGGQAVSCSTLDSDMALCTILKNLYNESKERLSQLQDKNASESIIKSEKVSLFVLSAGLFTFGRLDVAEDILIGIPDGRGSIRQLAWVLNVLLPMPKGFDALTNPTAVLEWLEIKRSRLKWDEKSEIYLLENFRILPDIPVNSYPEKFSAIDNIINGKELVVEILPDLGEEWLGCFQPGKSEFSGVYQHPNRIDLIIISGGQGYIINPETHRLKETVGGEIIEAIELPERRTILFQDTLGFISYYETGFLWRNQTLSWHSIRQLKLDGGLLVGECQRSINANWEPFWLDSHTGEFDLAIYDRQKHMRKKYSQNQPRWKFW